MTNLARLLRGRSDGILVAPFEQGGIGPDLFTAACDIGLEGLVSKRADRSKLIKVLKAAAEKERQPVSH